MTHDFHGMLDPLKVPLGTLRAADASIRKSYDVAVDSAGNLFMADTHNHAIRKVDGTTGIITTVAGTTSCGYNGDNQPATDAALYYPSETSVYEPSSLGRLPEIYRSSN